MSTNRIEQQNRLIIYLNSKTTQEENEEENLQQLTNDQVFFLKFFV